jgi:hypothetical protein
MGLHHFVDGGGEIRPGKTGQHHVGQLMSVIPEIEYIDLRLDIEIGESPPGGGSDAIGQQPRRRRLAEPAADDRETSLLHKTSASTT